MHNWASWRISKVSKFVPLKKTKNHTTKKPQHTIFTSFHMNSEGGQFFFHKLALITFYVQSHKFQRTATTKLTMSSLLTTSDPWIQCGWSRFQQTQRDIQNWVQSKRKHCSFQCITVCVSSIRFCVVLTDLLVLQPASRTSPFQY